MAFDKTKLFLTTDGSGYSYHTAFATQAEAEDQAKKNAAKNMEDRVVYKAVSLVVAPIPTNIVIEAL